MILFGLTFFRVKLNYITLHLLYFKSGTRAITVAQLVSYNLLSSNNLIASLSPGAIHPSFFT